MKIAIIGTGGVGGYFGSRLAKAGNEVTFIARGEHLRIIKENGLIVKSINGDFAIEHVHATQSIKEIEAPELVLICVKAWQVKDVAIELKSQLTLDSVVLPLQNGVLATNELGEILGHDKVLGGLCRIISKIESPGIISHFGVDPLIVFGEVDNSISPRIKILKEIFEKAGINARIANDIQSELWKKFISICVSGLLAVTKSTYDEVSAIPETRKLMVDLLVEIFELSKKVGIKIEDDFVSKSVTYIDAFPKGSTSSLARDVWAGKPSEIEYQNGTVVKLAEKHGVSAPINQFIYSCILPMEQKARS